MKFANNNSRGGESQATSANIALCRSMKKSESRRAWRRNDATHFSNPARVFVVNLQFAHTGRMIIHDKATRKLIF
jgi:hypothetical protein